MGWCVGRGIFKGSICGISSSITITLEAKAIVRVTGATNFLARWSLLRGIGGVNRCLVRVVLYRNNFAEWLTMVH